MRLVIFLAAFVAIGSARGRATDPELKVGVAGQALRFSWAQPKAGRVEIRELPLHTAADLAREIRTLTVVDAAAGAAEVPRFDGARDRLYAKFQLADATTRQPLGDAQHVTDFSALPRRTHALGSGKSQKGMSCQVDIPDCVALGIGQTNHNINIGALLDWQSAEPPMSFEFEGRKVGLRTGQVAALDASLRAMGQAGFRVTGIFLNYVGADKARISPLVHPLTAASASSGVVAAFNTATADGLFYYRAILHWLAERYTRGDAAYGTLAGLIIGNEVQSHWSWYHLGAVEPAVLLREYATALRVADLATRSVHADFPLYVSLDHHWVLPAAEDVRKGFGGVEVLESLNTRAHREGDFPWHLAFHPYPENLGNPLFWQDKTAPLRFDAARVTFHNLEVLPAYLSQPRFLYAGQPRRIALTEQGFHCPSGADGETQQAAAYALAWKKVQAMPSIECFFYHRHVDHPDEGGLRCGLREHDGSPNKSGMGRARKIWDVVRAAGTAQEDAAFAFALPIVGRKDWSNAVSAEIDRTPVSPARFAAGIVFDFDAQRAAAQLENTLAFELKRISHDAAWTATALQQHPNQRGLSRATWRVTVPAGQPCALRFTALLNHPESQGAGFAVKIDGKTVFEKKLSGKQSGRAEIDLAPWAGKKAAFDFLIDPLDNSQFAWATWVEPRIVLK